MFQLEICHHSQVRDNPVVPEAFSNIESLSCILNTLESELITALAAISKHVHRCILK